MTDTPEGQKVAGTLTGVPAARVMTGYRWLVEEKLGQDACTWVRERLDAGKSWTAVAQEMTQALGFPAGIKMSRTLLQKWCPDMPARPGETREPEPAEEDE